VKTSSLMTTRNRIVVSESDSGFNITPISLLSSPRTWEKMHKTVFSVEMIFVQLEKKVMSTSQWWAKFRQSDLPIMIRWSDIVGSSDVLNLRSKIVGWSL
jgi:hypothetical protein